MSAGRRLLLAVAMTIGVAGCGSLFEPYETLPLPQAGDQRQRVGVCFDGLASTPDQVRAAAQDACAANTVAERVDTDYNIQYCPLLLPGRATYACVPRR
jgi:hypothetical protein